MKKASDFLREAAEVIEQRGQLRDKPDGERSMARAVDAYISLNGPNIQSELDGWLFMAVLKLARATAGKPNEDDWTDLAGYAALAAECLGRVSTAPTGIESPGSEEELYDTLYDERMKRLQEAELSFDPEKDSFYHTSDEVKRKVAEGGFIPYCGDGMPRIDPHALVEVISLDGGTGTQPAKDWCWKWGNYAGDIVGWRRAGLVRDSDDEGFFYIPPNCG